MSTETQPGVVTLYAFMGNAKCFSFVGTVAELREELVTALERRSIRDQA